MMKCVDSYHIIVNETKLREIFMEKCNGIAGISPTSLRPWILVEGENKKLCWLRACDDYACRLCQAAIGDVVVTEKLYDSNMRTTMKLVARIESIKGENWKK